MTDGLEYLGRARFQGLTLLGVAFLVGCLAGFAGNRLMEAQVDRRPPPPGPPEGRPLPRPLEDLQLSPAQRRELDSLLTAGRPRAEAILKESLPRLQQLRDSVEGSIRQVLTAAQRDSFDAFNKAHPHRTLGPPVGGGLGGPEGRPGGPRGWRPRRGAGPPDWRDGPPPARGDGPPPPPEGDPGPPGGPDGPPH